MSYRGMGQVISEAATFVPGLDEVERRARTSAGGIGAAIAALFGRRSSPAFTAALTSLTALRGRPEIAAMAAEWLARPADQHRAGLLAIAEFAKQRHSGQVVAEATAGARGLAVGRGVTPAEIDAAAASLRSGSPTHEVAAQLTNFRAGAVSLEAALREIRNVTRTAAMLPGPAWPLTLAALTTALAAHHADVAAAELARMMATAPRGPATSGLGGYHRTGTY